MSAYTFYVLCVVFCKFAMLIITERLVPIVDPFPQGAAVLNTLFTHGRLEVDQMVEDAVAVLVNEYEYTEGRWVEGSIP